jgi:hypothetical protein
MTVKTLPRIMSRTELRIAQGDRIGNWIAATLLFGGTYWLFT